MNRKSGRKLKKKSHSVPILLSLVTVSLLIVVLLEFINYKNGKESFIFTRVLKKERTVSSKAKFNIEFLDYLNSGDFSYDYFKDTGSRYHFKIDIKKKNFKKILDEVAKLSKKFGFSLIPIEVRRENKITTYLYKADFNGKISHFLLINSVEPGGPDGKPPEVRQKPDYDLKDPRLAFIIDDIGAYSLGAYELKKLGIPITASVLPDSPHAAEEARWLHKYSLKTLIHLPMQPKKDTNSGHYPPNVITLSSTKIQIEDLIRKAKVTVPYAEGINNHEGSLVTSDPGALKKILEVIKGENLYFVDSKTDFDSLAYRTALSMNIKTAERDVFLDHTRSYEHSLFQIRRLVEIAKKTGKGIAIGHPFETTLSAIADSIDFIRASGVKIVFLNELLR